MTVAEIMSWLFLGRRPPKPVERTIHELRARAYEKGAEQAEIMGRKYASDGEFGYADRMFGKADTMRRMAKDAQRVGTIHGKSADSIIIDDPDAPWRVEEKADE